MQAKDWPSAVATAQQLVALKATSLNLKLLGNAQLFSGSADAALATYDQALAAAEKEKPAEGPAYGPTGKTAWHRFTLARAMRCSSSNAPRRRLRHITNPLSSHPMQGWLTSIFAPCSITLATRRTRRRPAASACKRILPGRMPGLFSVQISLPICRSTRQSRSHARDPRGAGKISCARS